MGKNWDNIGNEEEIPLHDEGTQQEVKEPEVTEVKMSKGKAGLVILAMILGLFILIVTIRGCSLSKEVNNTSNNQSTENTSNEEANISTKTGEEEENISKNSTTSEESNTGSTEKSNNSKNEVVEEEEDSTKSEEKIAESEEDVDEVENDKSSNNKGSNINKNNTFTEEEGMVQVAEPSLGNARTTTAMVSSKQVYKINDSSYAYSVNLVILTGTNTTVTVEYFCPRKTYDAIVIGDSLSVEYQMDSFGAISISSVSR